MYEDHSEAGDDEDEAEKDNRYSRQGHCFFIKDIELLTKTWECGGCGQRFNRHDNYNRHVTGDDNYNRHVTGDDNYNRHVTAERQN